MIKLYKKMAWFFKQEWKKYVVMLILLVLLSFLTVIPAKFLGLVIDTVAAHELTLASLLYLVGVFVLIYVFRYVFNYAYHYLINKEGLYLSYTLRKNYLNHLFEMDSKLYEEYTKGDLIARVTNDLDSITQSMTTVLQEVIYQGGVLIFALFMMFTTISWKLSLISASILPIGLLALNQIRMRKRRYYRRHREIYSEMTEKVLETVEGVKVIRAYVEEENDLKKVYKSINADIESWRKIVKFENWFVPLFDVIYSISYFLAFAFGTYFVITNEITAGELITFVIYIGMLSGPIISLSNIMNTASNAAVSADRHFEILEKIPDVRDEDESKDIIDFSKIEYRNVTFKYPFDKEPVLKNIDFTINKGETIGVVGPTGAGKSTLIRQLLREFNVTSGDIYIDDEPIEKFKTDEIRNLVGYVPQSHMLFKKPVEENILVGKPNAVDTDVQKAIQLADFTKDIAYLNDGLKTNVGEQGSALSGGQKQRLSIARALVRNPEILILDDSLSAVDAKTEETIISHLNENRKGKTNIIVAHRFSAIQKADKIIVLENGTITAIGTHEELLKIDGFYKRQYIIQTDFNRGNN